MTDSSTHPHTVPDWLARQVRQQPDGVALIAHQDAHIQRLTWRELDQQVALAAQALLDAGIRPHERVAILHTNQAREAILTFALLRIGAVLVPLNTRLTPAELRFQLTQTATAHLLALDAQLLEPLRDGTWSVLVPDFTAQTPYEMRPAANADQALAIIHTSGTSGKPKGAVLTHGSILAGALANQQRIPLSAEDRWLCVLPLYHVGGLSLLFRAAVSGFSVDLYPRFDLAAVDAALCRGDFTLVSLVPTMLYRLLREGNPRSWRNLRFVLLGGAAASAELLALAREYGVRVATTYGMTEAGSQVATALPDLAERKPGTVGKPLDGIAIRILNADGQPAAPHEYGEIVVRGAVLMREYDQLPQATAHSLRDGWYHTGDIGYLDDEGDLFLVQRRSDLIISGGENVYPVEVEAALRRHEAVEECAVVGIPDPEWGQRVAAAVVLKSGQMIQPTVLQEHLRTLLAGYKVPRLICLVEALPLTASGKIERHRVREWLEQAADNPHKE